MAFEVIGIGAVPNDDTGDTLRNGGIKINNNFAKAVEGPASANDGRVAVFDGNSGKAVKNGTNIEANLVTGPASANDGRVAIFDGSNGKVIKDSLLIAAQLVRGPLVAVDGTVASFADTTGTLIRGGLGSGSATSPSLTFLSDTDTGMFRPSANILAFTTNGVERARIASNGKITASAGTHWVGTVAETATSAVVEFGSNANGRYIRYPDGTQICWHRGALVDHTDALSSTTRLAGGWTYPIAFVAAASSSTSVNLPVHTNANFTGCSRLNITTHGPSGGTSTGISISVFFTGGVSTVSASIDNIQVTAIGRWY